MNEFTQRVFTTRGGRLGSGMGLLLEGLWGYHTSSALREYLIEIAWIADNQYNDYAVVHTNQQWNPATGRGELLRIEAKSMNLGADESKAHFSEITRNIGASDLLLILVWRWAPDASGLRQYPRIEDVFIDRALPIAQLRDDLHVARGGSFVERGSCPDNCLASKCTHLGEPLNANGKRERLQGPISTKPKSASHAANFGGLVRMLGTKGPDAKTVLERHRRNSPIVNEYIEFIFRNRGRRLVPLSET